MVEAVKHKIEKMELRRFIPTDIAASAIAHLSVLALIFLFAEVHPFGVVTAEPISVDIVTPDEVPPREPDPPPPPAQTPSPDASPQSKSEAVSAPETSQPQPAAQPPANNRPQQQAALSPQRPNRKEAAASQPQPQPQPPSPTPSPPLPAQAAPPAPAYTPPEPDLTLKYHVMLGLPEDLPLPAKPAGSGDKPGDGIDATASTAADVASNLVAEFRRHLKTCSKLPASVAPSDNVIIKLRVLMTPDGRLARDPILIEASASAKGPLLMQSAIGALQACQPYAMLPADRYGEWKVLDLGFSPRDFNS
jgi:outer membrane biosynthesis protein TonB